MPVHVKDHIELIQPTLHFNPRPSPNYGGLGSASYGPGPKQAEANVEGVSPDSLETCDQYMTLACLRALYSIDYTPVCTDKNTFGVGKSKTALISNYKLTIRQLNLRLNLS